MKHDEFKSIYHIFIFFYLLDFLDFFDLIGFLDFFDFNGFLDFFDFFDFLFLDPPISGDLVSTVTSEQCIFLLSSLALG